MSSGFGKLIPVSHTTPHTHTAKRKSQQANTKQTVLSLEKHLLKKVNKQIGLSFGFEILLLLAALFVDIDDVWDNQMSSLIHSGTLHIAHTHSHSHSHTRKAALCLVNTLTSDCFRFSCLEVRLGSNLVITH